MLEDDGHWLKLMRTATIPTDANICLRISGKDIVCTVTKDVNKEVELKVTCRIADPCHEERADRAASRSEHRKSPGASSALEEVELEERETVPADCKSSKAMLDYISNSVCSYSETTACSSSMNSREVSDDRSLKSETAESDIDMEEFKEEVSSSTNRESPSSDPNKEPRVKSEDDSLHKTSKSNESDSRKNKSNDESQIRRSPDYEHVNSEPYVYERQNHPHHPHHPSTNSSRNASTPVNPKSFCEACKIQFLSVNTYQVHKKFYCKSRHESEDMLQTVSVLESTSSGMSSAFKPSADTVILRGGLNGGIAPSVIQPQAIYAAISTNPLILLPCTLVPGQGLVPQNGVIPTGASGIVLQSGIACPTIVEKSAAPPVATETAFPPRKTSHPAMNVAGETGDKTLLSSSKISLLKRKMSEGDVLNLKKTCTSSEPARDKSPHEVKDVAVAVDQDSPLDLSVKVRKMNDAARKSPVRRRSSVISIGHPLSPVCGSKSPPGPSVISSTHNAPSPTNSYSNESTCYSAQVPVVVQRGNIDRISPLPPVLQSAVIDKTIPPPGMLPPKLMKQGNNICEECHIVFIKYDNLVTHKKHYCAYRRRQLSAMAAAAAAAASSAQDHSSDDNNSNHSGINDGPTGFQSDDSGKSNLRKIEYGVEHYRQVISKATQPAYCCDACGVKFSTSDTLVAHQTYYCMKKPDSAMAKASSKKGEESSTPLESPFAGPEEWKCNYCDAACSSYETMRRHLLTHSEPRGYRCLLCGYKGNTLRGMRTHACEHLTDESTSVEEFMSSTVISEGGGIPLIPRTFECSDEDSDAQKEPSTGRQRERTSSNNSETFKERTLKHDRPTTDLSESEDHSDSPRNLVGNQKESKRSASVKAESCDSNSDVSCHQDALNPLAYCDVVIKSEVDHTTSDEESEVKVEPDCNSDEKSAPASHQRSVIRIAERQPDEAPHPSKRKSRPQPKSGSDPKCCKTCGVSFQHLSNFLTHKKFYCDSRTLPNCLPEAATVQ